MRRLKGRKGGPAHFPGLSADGAEIAVDLCSEKCLH